MESDQLPVSILRKEIILDSHEFLQGLGTGYSIDNLMAIIHRIRANENLLRKEEKAMLDPEIWKFFYAKLCERDGLAMDPMD